MNPRNQIPLNFLPELMPIIDCDDLPGFEQFLQQKNISINAKFPLNASNLNVFINDSPSLVAVAAFAQADNIFDYLLEKNAILDSPNTFWKNKPLLHYALAGGSVHIIQKCIELNLDTSNALLPCVMFGYSELSESIYDQIAESVEAGTPPEDIFSIGFGQPQKPLKLAINSRDIDTIRFVISKFKDYYNDDFRKYAIFEKNKNALHIACKTEQNEIVELILSEFPELINEQNDNGQFPFEYAIKVNGIQNEIPMTLFKFIMEQTGDAAIDLLNHNDKFGMTPLHYAAKENHVDLINEMLQIPEINYKPQTTQRMETPFMLAVKNHHIESTITFLKNETEGDPIGLLTPDHPMKRYPLHFAAKDDWLEGFQEILMSVFEPDNQFWNKVLMAKDSSGMSPIMWAAVNGSVKVFQFLVDKTIEGTDITPFRECIMKDKVNVTERNPLHWAVIENQEEIVDIILEYKLINIDEFSRELPVTPLYYAVKNNNKKIIKTLRKNGADPHKHKDQSKIKSPYDTAKLEGTKQILDEY